MNKKPHPPEKGKKPTRDWKMCYQLLNNPLKRCPCSKSPDPEISCQPYNLGDFVFFSVPAVTCATEDTNSVKEKSVARTGSHRECHEFL